MPAEGADETLEIVEEDGSLRQQVWRYPGRGECATCHTERGGYALGFNSVQLNRDFELASMERDQIELFAEAGYFSNPPTPEVIRELRREIEPKDPHSGLHDRARSYLSVNCAFCHQPGTIDDYWDGRLGTSYEEMGLTSRFLSEGDPAASLLHLRLSTPGSIRMPPVGSYEIDPVGEELIRNWIKSFPQEPWQQVSEGAPMRDGSASVEEASDRITVAGASGGGTSGLALGHFLFQTARDSTQVSVRLDEQFCFDNLGEAGLMMRSASGDGAAFVGLQTDGKVSFEIVDGETLGNTGQLAFPPGSQRLRLLREGNILTAEIQPEDGSWVRIGQAEIPFGSGDLEIGLHSTSSSRTEVNTARFGEFGWSSVKLLPVAGADALVAGDPVLLEAEVGAGGTATVERVEFYRGDELLGEASAGPYRLSLPDQPAGETPIVSCFYTRLAVVL